MKRYTSLNMMLSTPNTFADLLVHSGCDNKIPQTMTYKQQLFLVVLDTGKSKIKARATSVSGDSLLLGCGLSTSHCVLTWWKGQGSSLGPL